MEKVDVLIIGGSAAGVVTAITARRYYKDAKITIIRKEKEGQVLVPCGIPYIFGTIGAVEKNIIPDALLRENNIDLIVDEATSIDREAKTGHHSQRKVHRIREVSVSYWRIANYTSYTRQGFGKCFLRHKGCSLLKQIA